jgi:homogentisate 1,2-dioxygenase
MRGFGNEHSSEALPGALPDVGNTPQRCPYGLYAEQVSGTSFTKKRCANQRSWFYRIRPSAAEHGAWVKLDAAKYPVTQQPTVATPEQFRWMPLPMPTEPTDFVQGLVCYCGAGDEACKAGIRVHMYACNTSMVNSSFSSADGDMLMLPQEGTLHLTTECGKMEVPPGFIVLIPRGIRFTVAVDGPSRGYVAEVFDSHFELPSLGVIGANGLSNARDFEVPVAAFEDREGIEFTNYFKYCGEMWKFSQPHSPYDVVAWHGNYYPYRYDLARFCAVNAVNYDHLDPSIFCVLTAPTGEPGIASCDFVIFPPRWMVAEQTFRPPYYHKNVMSEFMGNIRGTYEAKEKAGGFLPGGASLHSHMVAHGPEAAVFEKASQAVLSPMAPKHSDLAFMFESYYTLKLTPFAANAHFKDHDYLGCYKGFVKHFDATKK